MKKDDSMPFRIYKDGELVAQFERQYPWEQWLEHYKTTYPKSKITTEQK